MDNTKLLKDLYSLLSLESSEQCFHLIKTNNIDFEDIYKFLIDKSLSVYSILHLFSIFYPFEEKLKELCKNIKPTEEEIENIESIIFTHLTDSCEKNSIEWEIIYHLLNWFIYSKKTICLVKWKKLFFSLEEKPTIDILIEWLECISLDTKNKDLFIFICQNLPNDLEQKQLTRLQNMTNYINQDISNKISILSLNTIITSPKKDNRYSPFPKEKRRKSKNPKRSFNHNEKLDDKNFIVFNIE